MALSVLSLNIGMPQEIGRRNGQPVLSGIAKHSVGDRSVAVGVTGIIGDGQADLRAHGGPDKAVYAYPSEHLSKWSGELNEPLGPAAFGENLTTVGQTEQTAFIGDIWTWGTTVLQICQPRFPCYKLAMHRNRADMVERFLRSGRSGWYLRVLEPGQASRADAIRLTDRPSNPITVLTASRAVLPDGAVMAELEALAALAPLAASWKSMIRHRIDAAGR